jgi:hypothetical protein
MTAKSKRNKVVVKERVTSFFALNASGLFV